MGILDIPAELLQSIFILITPDAHVLVSRKKDPDQRQDFCEADVLNRSEWRKLLDIRYTCRGFRSNLDRALDSAKKTGDSRLIMELVEHKECPSIREEGKRSGNHDSSMAFITSFYFLRVSCPHLIRVSKPGEEAYAEESLEFFAADFALPAVVHLPTFFQQPPYLHLPCNAMQTSGHGQSACFHPRRRRHHPWYHESSPGFPDVQDALPHASNGGRLVSHGMSLHHGRQPAHRPGVHE
ncbi:unnamed protein product [Zymoseptoria tritici ST99CH_3D1]|nr:unnamed protein product [Zymoseptoria tritici ST99CH_3D1]